MLVAESTLENAQKITRKAEEVVSTGTGRRISPADVREWKNAATSVNEKGGSARSGSGFAERSGGGQGGGVVQQGVILATSLLKIYGDGRLAIVLFEIFY